MLDHPEKLNPILELKDATIAFGQFADQVALKDVNLKIYPNETIVLIGMSGAGKTVLLKTLAGLYQPVKGHSYCYGQEWDTLDPAHRHDLAQKIGMQFQKSALFDEIDAFDNVAYPIREHTRLTEKEVEERVLFCLKAVDLEKYLHMMPHEMSGGMRQRLGIARAIALRPEILFMDDPTAGLDPINSDNMAELILNLKNEIHATLVIVTHDLARVFQFAGRIIFIADKRVLETGSAEQTKNHPDPRVQQFLQGQVSGPLTLSEESLI